MMSVENKQSLSQSLFTAEQVRKGERQAAKAAGLSMRQLMALAGKAVFHSVREQVQEGARIAVCCGEGNNGGDGYVMARLAQQAGYRVTVFALKPQRELDQTDSDDAQHARQAWRDGNNTELGLEALDATQFDIIVDAMFGTGLSRPIEGRLERWAQTVNQAKVPIVAVDIPSGIDADTGRVLGAAINADHTITMIAKKRGLLTGAATEHCGRLQVATLSVATEFLRLQTAEWQIARCYHCQQWLGARRADAHKGDNGHVLIVGGDKGMPGAVVLAMQAALRGGAGKVSVACHPDNIGIVAAAQAEAMVHGVESKEQLQPLLEQATTLVLGPGLGRNSWSQALFEEAMKTSLIKVVDADALNLLALNPQSSERLILTPHPGEAARLLDCSTSEIQDDRYQAVTQLREKYRGHVLLKGAGSVIASGRGQFVISRGSPAMASGGMGDCLSGLIGALLGQGLAPAQALIAGSFWHAVAGEMAGKEGIRGTLASDLLSPIRQLVNGLKTIEVDDVIDE